MEYISSLLVAHTVHRCGCLIVIIVIRMFTVVTVITAYLYWRCCCFLTNDCLNCEDHIQLNAGARRKVFILKRGRPGGGKPKTLCNLC